MRASPVLAAVTAGCALFAAWTGPAMLWLPAVLAGGLWVQVWRRSPHPRIDRAREIVSGRSSSARTAIDRSDRTRRQHGLASRVEIRRHGSANTVRRLAPQVRPSLPSGTRRERRRIHPDEVGVELCTVGRQRVYASIEDVTLAIAGPRQFKALALDTPVPTPSGWTTMGELREGDELYDEAGRPCRVTAAHPVRHDRPCYEVAFSDGSAVVADAEHLWQVETRKSRQGRDVEKVLTTEELLPRLRIGSERRANYSVRAAQPLDAPDVDLPIAPYTLGAWLGDGANRGGLITLGGRKAEVVDAIRADGYELTEQPSSRRGTSTAYNVTTLITALRRAGLRHNKHIPPVYFRASKAQRQALLAGLLDTDGMCTAIGGVVFTSTRRRLAEDVRSLIATLGYVSTISEYRARLNGQDAGPVWYVKFCPDEPVFRVERKAQRQSTKNSVRNKRRFILDIRPVESVPVRCITVDSPSSLYLVGDQCIATHNSGWIASRIGHFPGPMVVTSTRTDLHDNTQDARRQHGPVWVFNAGGIDELDADAVTFDPLIGCEDPDIASERAVDMIPTDGGPDAEKWQEQARLAFSALLHAAALGGLTIDAVRTWVADPKGNATRILRILEEKSPAPSTVDDAAQFVTTNDRTQTSITTSIAPAVKWLQSKNARRAAGLEDLWNPVSMEQVLAGRGTLYVIGQIDDHVAPLMSALTGYVARNARRAARARRLDPPLGLALDEAHQLKPPLPDWSSNMGGSGITLLVATQSRAELINTWGPQGAAVVLNNAGAILLGGGTKDPDDLKAWSELAGQRDERTETRDRSGRTTSSQMRQVPVLPPAQLTNLAPRHVVVFRRGMPPALGRARMVWEPAPLRDRATTLLRRGASLTHLPRRDTSSPSLPVEEV